ncbi:hypothetical protein OG292_25720 [Streptomyces sp. NBC_01511]|uniref:hypothetical protein n=1 Tax=Streptomyces sp. NBC_01511 TaxID=2903889 RepID=UPI00386FABED
MKADLFKEAQELTSSDADRARRALFAICEASCPQRVMIERDAVEYIPVLFEAGLSVTTLITPEIFFSLGRIHTQALWGWKDAQLHTSPEHRSKYDEMVAWETSVAAAYERYLPAVVALVERGEEVRDRCAGVYLLSQMKEHRNDLVGFLRSQFDDSLDARLKVDIIEALANLGFGTGPMDEVGQAVHQWVRGKLSDPSPAIRLGALLSLSPRVDDDQRKSLKRDIVQTFTAGRAVVNEAVWLLEGSIAWAIRREISD